jgi:hypothetical protein
MMKNITLNFGVIRDTVAKLSTAEILKESNNNVLKSFTNMVKKNPTLLKQHYIFKNIEDAKPFNKERLAERFINQNLAILKGIKWQDVIKNNKNIRISLLENYHVESAGGKKDELFNNIHTLIESVTNPGFINLEAEQKSYEYILEHLTRTISPEEKTNEKNDNPSLNNWQYITKLAINNFNERYSNLEECEKKVLKMLLSDDNKKFNYIKDLKNENLTLIDKILKKTKNLEQISLLKEFKEKMNKNNTIDTFIADDYVIAYSELNDKLLTM